MKEYTFGNRGDYANYMALMELADEESVLPELMLTGKGLDRIKMDISLSARYNLKYIRHYARSLLKGYPKSAKV